MRYKNWQKTDKLEWMNNNGARLQINNFGGIWDVMLWKAKDSGTVLWSENFSTRKEAYKRATTYLKTHDHDLVSLTAMQRTYEANWDEIMNLGCYEEHFYDDADKGTESVSLRFTKAKEIPLSLLLRLQTIFSTNALTKVDDEDLVVRKNMYGEFTVTVTKLYESGLCEVCKTVEFINSLDRIDCTIMCFDCFQERYVE